MNSHFKIVHFLLQATLRIASSPCKILWMLWFTLHVIIYEVISIPPHILEGNNLQSAFVSRQITEVTFTTVQRRIGVCQNSPVLILVQYLPRFLFHWQKQQDHLRDVVPLLQNFWDKNKKFVSSF